MSSDPPRPPYELGKPISSPDERPADMPSSSSSAEIVPAQTDNPANAMLDLLYAEHDEFHNTDSSTPYASPLSRRPAGTSTKPNPFNDVASADEPALTQYAVAERKRTTHSGVQVNREGDENGRRDVEQDRGADLNNGLAQLAVSNLAGGDDDDAAAHPSESAEEETITNEEKVEAIVESFGPFKVGGKVLDEVLLSEVKGGLFRDVVMIGNIHLTNRRMVFNAVFPPSDLIHSKTSSGGPVIVKSGPVLIRSHGMFKPDRRVWMELGLELISTFPDSSPEGRIRPLKTVILSSVKKISPSEDPCSFTLTIDSSTGPRIRVLEFDTEESALDWRRELEGALFHFNRLRLRSKNQQSSNETPEQAQPSSSFGNMEDWDMVKISLPLDRIVKEEVADYMGYATLIGLEINNSAHPSASPASSVSTGLEHEPRAPIHLKFAVLNDHARFVDAFLDARSVARNARSPYEISSLPIVVMDGIFSDGREEGQDGRAGRREEPERSDSSGSRKVRRDAEAQVHAEIYGEGELDKKIRSIFGDGEGKLDKKLRTIFGLGDNDDMWTIACGLQRTLVPLKGNFVISDRYVGFFRKERLVPNIKYRFSISDCVRAITTGTYHIGTYGLTLQSSGHADISLEFGSEAARDETMNKINDTIATYQQAHISSGPRSPANSQPPSATSSRAGSSSSIPHSTMPSQVQRTQRTRHGDATLIAGLDAPLPTRTYPDEMYAKLPKIVNLFPNEEGRVVQRRILEPRHFVCLTIGSRGDVQPYIALCIGLMKDGHRCTIVTHQEFEKWIRSYDIGFREAGGSPDELMALCGTHRMFSPGFFQESLGHFRDWLDDLFRDSYNACLDADVLIESPSAMAGIHIAEALNIPYFRAFTMPWTRTSSYPQAFMVPPRHFPGLEIAGNYNFGTYVLFDNVIWHATSGQVNRWRQEQMNLPPTDMDKLAQEHVPFIYNFSSAVVPHPNDWKDNIYISGYWNLENSDEDWSPPDDLNEFIKKARRDERPLVYIGFGSILVPDPNKTTRNVIRAVEAANVRAIIAKGWSSKGAPEKDAEGNEVVVEFPESCYSMDKVPHSWLFNQIDAAVHHGGAGTTGASLRAGIPTIIHPYFGDQEFWAVRVARLGVGLSVASLGKDALTQALVKATTDPVMRQTAAKVGERIRAEDGTANAINWIYSYIVRAKDRHQQPPRRTEPPTTTTAPSKRSTAGLLSSLKLSHAFKIKSRETQHD